MRHCLILKQWSVSSPPPFTLDHHHTQPSALCCNKINGKLRSKCEIEPECFDPSYNYTFQWSVTFLAWFSSWDHLAHGRGVWFLTPISDMHPHGQPSCHHPRALVLPLWEEVPKCCFVSATHCCSSSKRCFLLQLRFQSTWDHEGLLWQ